jgi:L-ascorbate metabolism protein UlaG (beta-lactamase superfamily)
MSVEITWFGHSCFRLRNREVSIITDPFDASAGLGVPRLTADIVTVSCHHPHHNHALSVHGDARLIDSPGEYEIRAVFITGTATYPPRRPAPPDDPALQRNIVFVFEFGQLTVCHLGALTHMPPQEQVQALNMVDVLIVPVGGGERSLNATRAAETVSLVEPKLVIPMHYRTDEMALPLDGVDKFLKEMGIGRVEPVDGVKVSENSLPQETQVVVLRPPGR